MRTCDRRGQSSQRQATGHADGKEALQAAALYGLGGLWAQRA